MRTTIVLDDKLVQRAQKLTGIKTKREVVHEALRTLILLREDSCQALHLIQLSLSQVKVACVPMRRSALVKKYIPVCAPKLFAFLKCR